MTQPSTENRELFFLSSKVLISSFYCHTVSKPRIIDQRVPRVGRDGHIGIFKSNHQAILAKLFPKTPYFLSTSKFTSSVELKSIPIQNLEASQDNPAKNGSLSPDGSSTSLIHPGFLHSVCWTHASAARWLGRQESHLDAQCIFHFPWGSNQKNLWLK